MWLFTPPPISEEPGKKNHCSANSLQSKVGPLILYKLNKGVQLLWCELCKCTYHFWWLGFFFFGATQVACMIN